MNYFRSSNLRTDGGNRRTSRSSVDSRECLSCGGQLHPEVKFCRHCGTKSPFDVDGGPTARDDQTVPAEPSVTDVEQDEYVAEVESNTDSRSATSTQEPHPIETVAEQLQNNRSFDTDATREICQLLRDPPSDDLQLKNELSNVLETVETQQKVAKTVESIGESPTADQLDSTERELHRIDGDLSKTVATVIANLRDCEQKVTKYENERDKYQDETKRICKEASRQTSISLDSNSPLACAQELTDELRRGAVSFQTSGEEISQVANDVEQSVGPVSSDSQMLLNGLKNAENSEIADVLQTTIETLEEYNELQTALADISDRDVRRQLDSLDADLQQNDEPVYRHLADRVRELEAMVDRESVDNIKLYAIYQESRFYDRTLIPRLARTTSSPEPLDVGEQIDGIQSRIDAIRTEYVNVRADHNHTIPNHFLELADSLCSRAQRLEREQPQQAAGMLAAAAELLGHIEQLYERNEYSVMLRRLRG